MPEAEQVFAALHAPVGAYTWEVQASLSNTVRSTNAVPVHFRRPVEIIGFRPIVRPVFPLAGGGLVTPTVDDIEVLVDVNNRDRLTNQIQETTGAGAGAAFVTLSALGIDVPRLTRYQLRDGAPDMSFEFRWAQFAGAGPAPFEDALIRLALFCRHI